MDLTDTFRLRFGVCWITSSRLGHHRWQPARRAPRWALLRIRKAQSWRIAAAPCVAKVRTAVNLAEVAVVRTARSGACKLEGTPMGAHSSKARPRRVRRLAVAAATTAAVCAFGLINVVASQALAAQFSAASDDFGRSVSSGLGTAETGGDYTLDYPGSINPFSVVDGAALIKTLTPGKSVAASLMQTQLADVHMQSTSGLTAIPDSQFGLYHALESRRQSDGSTYRSRLTVGSSGLLSLSFSRTAGSNETILRVTSIPAVLSVGQSLNLETTVTGSNPVVMKLRAWKGGTARPEWQLTYSDSSAQRIESAGGVGTWQYLSSSSAASSFILSHFMAVPLPSEPAVIGSGSTDGGKATDTSSAPATTVEPSTSAATTAAAPSTSLTPTSSVATATTSPSTTWASTPPATNSTQSTIATTAPTMIATALPTTATTTIARTPPTTATTTPTTTTTTAAAPVTPPGGSRGAATIGSTLYPVPAGSLFVSPSGSDAEAGSQGAPLRTLAAAVARAVAGQMIVLRAGSYHESVVVNKDVTIQSYPGEAAWLDGSSMVTGWARSGATWKVGGWTTEFDSSPSYSRGSAGSSLNGWNFINADYPMAAHPDQVWIDGVAQEQVASLSSVSAGKFYVDYASDGLYLGSDPTGREARSSTLSKALTVTASGVTLRGFGVTRYAPSVPDIGAVALYGNGSSVANVVFSDISTTGLSVGATDVVLRDVTSTRSGMLGIQANYADRLSASGLLVTDNNTEHFNYAPVAGGLKVTRSRNVSITDSEFDRNLGTGLWLDESVYQARISGNIFNGNADYSVIAEISANVQIVNNVVVNGSNYGIGIFNTSNAVVANNTISRTLKPVFISQDSRVASNLSTAGHDPRQSLPDPTVTWLTGPVQVFNNVMTGTVGNSVLSVQDYGHVRSASQMSVAANGNVYQRSNGSWPSWLVVWARQGNDPAVFTSLASFQNATGQESSGVEIGNGSNAVDSNGAVIASIQSMASTVAVPVTSLLSPLIGQAVGVRHLGAWITLG